MTTHRMLIRSRPFNAIKNKTKTIEVRANKRVGQLDYSKIRAGDLIIFINQETHRQLICTVERVTHYADLRTLLTTERTNNTLSSGGDIDAGIKSIEAITDYKKVIKEKGAFAIKIRLLV